MTQLEIEHEVSLEAPGDEFQRRARLLQAIWREERGYPIGRYTPPRRPERTMGSLLEMPWARVKLANFLTERIARIAHDEVLGPNRNRQKVYKQPRIFDNLLSSQPLCFNLMAELQPDLGLATEVFRDLMGEAVREVRRIVFEFSPERWSTRHTNDGSAFDVFVEYVTQNGRSAFVGLEAKYHEPLTGEKDNGNPLYRQRAEEMACFLPQSIEHLTRSSLRQVWRDHLLAGAMIKEDGYESGTFVLLRPRGSTVWSRVADDYRRCLSDEMTFSEWLLEDFVEALRRQTDAAWVELFFDRYLDFGKVDRELARLSAGGV